MASEIYGKGVEGLVSGGIDWKASGGSTIKAKLCLSSLAYSAAHEHRDDVSAGDTTGATDVALTLSDPDSGTADTIKLKADASLTFDSVTTGQTVGSVIVYHDTGDTTTDTLIAFLDIASTDTNGGDVVVTLPGSVYAELDY